MTTTERTPESNTPDTRLDISLNSGAPLESQPREVPQVLVVDDAPEIALLFAVVLKKVGAIVSVVDNGYDAVLLHQKCQDEGTPFSLIILDWSMPNMGGLEVARFIRTKDEQIKIVFITAYHDALNSQQVQEVKAELWAKPIDIHTLSQNLHRLLG